MILPSISLCIVVDIKYSCLYFMLFTFVVKGILLLVFNIHYCFPRLSSNSDRWFPFGGSVPGNGGSEGVKTDGAGGVFCLYACIQEKSIHPQQKRRSLNLKNWVLEVFFLTQGITGEPDYMIKVFFYMIHFIMHECIVFIYRNINLLFPFRCNCNLLLNIKNRGVPILILTHLKCF